MPIMDPLRVDSSLEDQPQERESQPPDQNLEKQFNPSPRGPCTNAATDISSNGDVSVPDNKDNHSRAQEHQPKSSSGKENDIDGSNPQNHDGHPELFMYSLLLLACIIAGICYATLLWKYYLEPCFSARSIPHIGGPEIVDSNADLNKADHTHHEALTFGLLLPKCIVTNFPNEDLTSPIIWVIMLYASIIQGIWCILKHRSTKQHIDSKLTKAQEMEIGQQHWQKDAIGRENTVTISLMQEMVMHFFWPFHSFKVDVKKVSIFDPLPVLFFFWFLSRNCFQQLYMKPCYQHMASGIKTSSINNEDLHQAHIHIDAEQLTTSQCLGLFRDVVNSSPGDFVALVFFCFAFDTLFLFYLVIWYKGYQHQGSRQREDSDIDG